MQQEVTLHRQILARLSDPAMQIRDEVRMFWGRLQRKGITPQLAMAPGVKVMIPRSSGAGDVFTSLMEAQALMQIRPALPPASQPIALRKFLLAVTQDPTLVEQLVPQQPEPPPDVMRAKTDVAVASLGMMPIFDRSLNLPAYLPAFVGAIGEGLQSEAQEPEPDAADVEGFQKALAIAAQLLGQLAQDQAQGQMVGQLKKQIGALSKVAVEIAKQIAEARDQEGQGQDPAMLKAMNDIKNDNEKAQADMARRVQELEQQNVLFTQQLQAAAARTERAEDDAELKRTRAQQEEAQQAVLFNEQFRAATARADTAELGVEIAQTKAEAAEKQKNQIGKEKPNAPA
jgi:hypothetical protein